MFLMKAYFLLSMTETLFYFYILVNQKRFARYGTSNRIQMLEERANLEDDNPKAQADYLRVNSKISCFHILVTLAIGLLLSDNSDFAA